MILVNHILSKYGKTIGVLKVLRTNYTSNVIGFQSLYTSTSCFWCNFKELFKFIQHLVPDLHTEFQIGTGTSTVWSSEISLRVILLIETLAAFAMDKYSWSISILLITLMSKIKSDCVFPYRYQRHCQLQGSHETVSFQCEIMSCAVYHHYSAYFHQAWTVICMVLLNL